MVFGRGCICDYDATLHYALNLYSKVCILQRYVTVVYNEQQIASFTFTVGSVCTAGDETRRVLFQTKQYGIIRQAAAAAAVSACGGGGTDKSYTKKTN